MSETKPVKLSKKMGRPKIVIDDRIFDTVIQLPLIKADIAGCCFCSEDTLDTYIKRRFGTTFSVLHGQKKNTFRKNILGKQYELAMKGNIALLIWLGKQHLNQSEKVESKQEIKQTSIVYESEWGSFEPTDKGDT